MRQIEGCCERKSRQRYGIRHVVKFMALDEGEEIPEFESKPCPICGGTITVVKMDFRFAGRYTCPQCGSDVLFTDEAETN
jgi:predicted RNA-binding Zn-ribbon protein involved in translation (DUF1610 family)